MKRRIENQKTKKKGGSRKKRRYAHESMELQVKKSWKGSPSVKKATEQRGRGAMEVEFTDFSKRGGKSHGEKKKKKKSVS